MSPYQIQIMLTIHVTPSWRDMLEDIPRNRLWYETMEWLKRERFVEADDTPTDRLHVYCKALCDLPAPVEKWVMP